MQPARWNPSPEIASLPVEAQVLLHCACTRPAPERAAGLAPLLAALDGEGWRRLIGLGARFGLLSVLYLHLKALPADGMGPAPRDALDQMRVAHRKNATNSMRLGRELVKLVSMLRSHGVDVLPLKGVSLAAQFYGDAGLRQLGDVDLLIRPQDYGRAAAALESCGFGPRHPDRMSPDQELAWSRLKHERVFRGPEKFFDVDLHWGAFDPLILDFVFDDLWARRVQVDLDGRRLDVLSAEDQVVYLCAHGSKHAWSDLRWVMDVAELLRACPDLRWEEVQRRAAAVDARRMLWVGLGTAGRLLDAPLPADLQEAMAGDKAVSVLLDEACSDLLAGLRAEAGTEGRSDAPGTKVRRALDARYGQAPVWVNLRLLRHQERGAAARIAAGLRNTLTPGAREIGMVALPPLLHPLYYGLRLVRLIGRAAAGAWTSIRK